MPDAEISAIINHLIFHKALLDNKIDVDHYIEMVQKMDEGIHIIAKNPVDKAIAIVFELVMRDKMDPWNINLLKFVKTYMHRVRNENDIDFVIAGKLIYMAWNILKRKSDHVLDRIEEESYGYDYDFFGMDIDVYGFESPLAKQCEDVKIPEIKEPVRREEKRPVSLFELIEAINEARVEIEESKRRKKIREKFRFNIEEKVHREDLEEDIKETWERLSQISHDEILLSLIYDGTNESFVKVFLSLLFLERFGKVELSQPEPYGEIYVHIKVPEELRAVEFIKPPEVFIEEI